MLENAEIDHYQEILCQTLGSLAARTHSVSSVLLIELYNYHRIYNELGLNSKSVHLVDDNTASTTVGDVLLVQCCDLSDPTSSG